jgi:hypothetical protein
MECPAAVAAAENVHVIRLSIRPNAPVIGTRCANWFSVPIASLDLHQAGP